MGVIYILLKILSSRLGIAVPVLIIWVFHMEKRSHPHCLHLEDPAPELLMKGGVSTTI